MATYGERFGQELVSSGHLSGRRRAV